MADEQELTYSYQTVKALVQHRDEEIAALTQQLAETRAALGLARSNWDSKSEKRRAEAWKAMTAALAPTAGDAGKDEVTK